MTTHTGIAGSPRRGGICLRAAGRPDTEAALTQFRAHLAALDLDRCAAVACAADAAGHYARFQLADDFARAWVPGYDTTGIRERSRRDPQGQPRAECDLEREILIAMLAAPLDFEFPGCDEALACVRMRANIARAGARTALAFHTTKAERPEDYWVDDPERGFIVRPGKSLIEALRLATQPEASGMLYSFSCYRATEYVILLGIAQELATCNPPLFAQLQRQCETRVIRSAQFHDTFLIEYGSMEEPLPPQYYVPGDRLWFRNPDAASSDIIGYEGSWVFYLGGGLFSNFWKSDQPYTLASKCIEIYHWRHGARRDAGGEPAMDEDVVEARVRATQADPQAAAEIVARMMRLRDPKGIYAEGGCIDTTREYPRRVCPGTADLVLPGS
ncbi:MAG: hypothetical protein A2045_06375 [Rhodocyclales bacterium GWA2_65_20]|nr:MAG: hypothetical protein A2045_06375 [Rhodocyclales bacterium GWA2_65_20]